MTALMEETLAVNYKKFKKIINEGLENLDYVLHDVDEIVDEIDEHMSTYLRLVDISNKLNVMVRGSKKIRKDATILLDDNLELIYGRINAYEDNWDNLYPICLHISNTNNDVKSYLFRSHGCTNRNMVSRFEMYKIIFFIPNCYVGKE